MNLFKRFIQVQFRKNETALHPLTYLFWECTLRCNLKCLHCGSDCHSESSIPDLPFEDFFNAIKPLKNKYTHNSIIVAITGGEPLLRPDLCDCGLALRKNGFRWGIVTNGFMYNETMHAKLLSAGMGAVTLSLDGLEQTHNWLRNNPKSFQKAIQALDLISSSKQLTYDVVSCVHKRNLHELENLKQLLIEHKVKAWRLFTIAPIGRAAHQAELSLNGIEIKELMDFIAQARKEKQLSVTFSCEAYMGDYEHKIRDTFFFCRAGINIASVLIDGSISACPNIDRSFIQGNIYKDDLLTIWETKFNIMRNRTWTKTGKCKQCNHYSYCLGGAMHLWDSNRNEIHTCLFQNMKNS